MKFGVYYCENNNADGLGCFYQAGDGLFCFNQGDVRLTNQGIVIFNLSKKISHDEKLRLTEELHQSLLEEFGTGLTFAASGASLSVKKRKIEPFFQKAKEIDSRIINIFTDTLTPNHQPIHFPDGISFVDHFVDSKADNLTADMIVAIVSPTIDDLSEPQEGWDRLDRRLNTLFDSALRQAKQPKLAITYNIAIRDLSAETILKMNAPQLIAAWNDVATSATDVPDAAVYLVDPTQMLVSRMHAVGLAHIQNGEKINSATLEDFKLATDCAIQFLQQQSATSKVAPYIQRLVENILPKLE